MRPFEIGEIVRFAGREYRVIDIERESWAHFVAMEILRTVKAWKLKDGSPKRIWRWVDGTDLERTHTNGS